MKVAIALIFCLGLILIGQAKGKGELDIKPKETELEKNNGRKGGGITVDIILLLELVSKSIAKVYEGGKGEFVDNEAVYCIWDQWETRDQVAKIQRTFVNCRFHRVCITFVTLLCSLFNFYKPRLIYKNKNFLSKTISLRSF